MSVCVGIIFFGAIEQWRRDAASVQENGFRGDERERIVKGV